MFLKLCSARDSNQFTVSVNVEGNSTAIFVLIYEELLVRSNGIYNHDINLHPGNLVPNLKVVVNIKEPQVISTLRVPELRTGNDVAATENDPQNKNAVIEKDDDDQGVTITFKPDLEEQKRLAKVYLEKTKDKDSSNRYSRNTETTQTSTVLGQFVVQYDLEQPCTGEVFISDGYFAHFFAPTSLPPLGKNVIFVLDISGSMIGRKIEQLKSAMNTILSDLNEYDRFSIVVFNSIVTVQDLKDADLPAPKTPIYFPTVNSSSKNVTLVPPSVASPENIAKAKKIVNKLVANGGTNIYEALLVGLNIKDKGVEWDTEKKSTSNKGCSRCNSGWEDGWDVEWYEPEEIHNKLEPVIIFLTDGQATVGETNTNRIIANITKKNFESEPASIYTLPLGKSY
ncbi:inter-alpha-trypsin inhibitor heavy chain H3-like [Bicyclus anynana]|uniref:Inter-alpha-trypsin inhibitor heavy chain H3-like n=1 Tax=Bicyclus anynana TaxID=110368 RepID=A0ABM3M7V3_BICAN|nr:inter-alpha-trypsin inhibitor heavy chain H3-like [Bicyclus anynana]